MTVEPLAKLTGPLRGILIASIVVSILAVVGDLYSYAEYSSLTAEQLYSDEPLGSDAMSGLVGILQVLLVIALIVTFLRWVYRANKNLRALSGEPMSFTPGWSVGWFFIPIANLFKPYQAVKEIWRVSHEGTSRGHTLVNWWWALFILCNVLSQAAFRSSQAVGNVDDYLVSTWVYAVSDGADAVGQTVTLLLVGAIAAAYASRVDETRAVAGVGAAGPAGLPAAPVPAAVVPAVGVVSAAGWVPVAAVPAAEVASAAAAPAAEVASAAASPAAWHADPLGRHELRWWDGAQWSAWVADGGERAQDPI